MELVSFIQGLITEGRVAVGGELSSFEEEDLRQSAALLRQYYAEDAMEMPFAPPAFLLPAALWAAEYFYTAVQLTVLREAGAEMIQEKLKEYPGSVTPESIYSADLVLRYLPALLGLARGLAPADSLVQELRKTAEQWPFSSVGADPGGPVNDAVIFSHACLRQVYTDRILEQKDKKRLDSADATQSLYETTGEYLVALWPDAATGLNR